ncbi:MAG TPA: sigma-70 family RNA polymerase sigma factor [Ohtaekwangia sp.]|nr:sigma-70 family RNA polymerase sigma factor [Ohtaekwangia sp.]
MKGELDKSFLQHINDNLGIARKVSRVYCPDPDDREDLFQEMMYQLWKSYANFDGLAKFSTWMYRVCLNTALTYRRKKEKERNQPLSGAHDQIALHDEQTNDHAIAMLFDAIATLSPVNKAIVLLYLENMSYAEIASVTGMTTSNVSVRLVRIKKELERQLKDTLKSASHVNP